MEIDEEKKNFPAKLENLHDMMVFVAESAKKQSLEDKNIEEIILAVEEAVANIIKYAYPNSDGDIEIRCSPEGNSGIGITIIIKDKGIPFNPLEHDEEIDVSAPIEEREIGGLGIFMMQKIMDHVLYSRENDSNILTMTKK
ncbi:MAG: ATP-binding protein [Waddliaceae bacterium]|nr:ATP-binding protein [Waddliaceae bacterium]MBT3578676.1 ATP-binding protein [Waddliaceae bacterium]MBT4445395.1 ATP-binding protein [Waddliaceae bacterium]MBT6928337.1 ATP-binding protein [Waddliaceae bacterium]MBT7265023.1 ATP-binding protein [Waddliaceae bacterium]